MLITTVLQIYKRNTYLQKQIDAILKQTIKSDKIIIVHNEGGVDFNYPENVQLIYANPNKKFHLRFAVGLLVDTEYVAFFDDDTLPGSKWFENCINTINKHDCICVANGRDVIPENKTQTCPGGWCNPKDQEVQCWFGGHAWFLKTKNLKYMWFDDIIEHNNGEDIQLSANAWLYKKIQTFIPPHPISEKELWGSLKGMELGSDKVASYLVNPSHYIDRWNLIEYYLTKGWNPI